jgi:hypothetical protein
MNDTKHTPGPLKIIAGSYERQYRILGKNHHVLGQNWDDVYFNVSGYFGSYGPEMFAAAPETAAERDRLRAVNKALRAALQFVVDVYGPADRARAVAQSVLDAEGGGA